MEKKTTISIIAVAITLLVLGVIAFSFLSISLEFVDYSNGENELINEKMEEKITPEEERVTEEYKDVNEFFSGMIVINERGFNESEIRVKKGQPSFLIGSEVDGAILTGDKIYQEGRELNQSSAIGFPLNRLADEGVEEVNLWIEGSPDQMLKIIIVN